MKNVFLLLLLLVPCFSTAQDNLFIKIEEKKYIECSQELFTYFRESSPRDSTENRRDIGEVKESVRKTGNIELMLMLEYLEILLFEEKMALYGSELYTFDELRRLELDLLKKTQKAKTLPIELLVRWKLIYFYLDEVKDYESCFEECTIQDKKLQTVSSEDLPDKAHLYLQIANNYFFFKDFKRANYFFKKILEEKETVDNQLSQQGARNGLGLSFTEINQLDSAEIYFQAMKQITYLNNRNEIYHDIFDAISEGNTGVIMMLRGEIDKAFPLFESSLEKAIKCNDYPFAGNRAVDIANIYLKKEILPEAKKYIDLAITYRNKTKNPRNNDLFYEVLSKYFAATGNAKQSIIYLDSMLTEKKKIEEKFNTSLLLRMEQKESARQQQELVREKEKLQQSQLRLLILATGFIIIIGLLVIISFQYRIKNAAYRELVRKSQEWAKNYKEEIKTEYSISEIDRQLFEQLQQMFQHEHLFREPTISIEDIAQRMKVNRTYLSRAVNHCTGKNFNVYINEYRIKEAVRLMSKNSNKFSLEGLAFEVGFNDRKTFYTAFRKMTGLSPSEFRANMRDE